MVFSVPQELVQIYKQAPALNCFIDAGYVDIEYRYENGKSRVAGCDFIDGPVFSITDDRMLFLLMRCEECVSFDNGIIRIGDTRLLVIGKDEMLRSLYVTLDESWKARIYKVYYPILSWLRLINYRLLWTCRVWNLAEFEFNVIPSWDDLYLVKRVKRWLKK